MRELAAAARREARLPKLLAVRRSPRDVFQMEVHEVVDGQQRSVVGVAALKLDHLLRCEGRSGRVGEKSSWGIMLRGLKFCNQNLPCSGLSRLLTA